MENKLELREEHVEEYKRQREMHKSKLRMVSGKSRTPKPSRLRCFKAVSFEGGLPVFKQIQP